MDHVDSVGSAGFAPQLQSFTVLIPRALQRSVDRLPSEVRQQVMTELYRVASDTGRERAGVSPSYTYALRMEVAGCVVSVEMDDARSRLMLTGLSWQRPHS